MEKLTFIEKDCFEKLFGMDTGYVLDFSNRTFQEFIYSVLNFDVYYKYGGLSKAKMIRAIISEYSSIEVGKLLLELMRYMQTKNMIDDKNRETFKLCKEVGNKMIGKSSSFAQPKTTVNSSPKPITSLVDYEKCLKELKNLSDCEDSPQARGFAFEKYQKTFLK